MIKQEFKKLTEVQEFLESNGLKVWREVIPDQCVNWDMPYRVDLIFEIPNYGYIGVEGKDLNTHGQGSKYADAYLQIRDKYKNKTYFGGNRIRRWCVLGAAESGNDRTECFIKHFLNRLGISYFEFLKNDLKKSVDIDSLTTNRICIKDGVIKGIDKKSPLDYGVLIK